MFKRRIIKLNKIQNLLDKLRSQRSSVAYRSCACGVRQKRHIAIDEPAKAHTTFSLPCGFVVSMTLILINSSVPYKQTNKQIAKNGEKYTS